MLFSFVESVSSIAVTAAATAVVDRHQIASTDGTGVYPFRVLGIDGPLCAPRRLTSVSISSLYWDSNTAFTFMRNYIAGLG